jgi:hypothetical protein
MHARPLCEPGAVLGRGSLRGNRADIMNAPAGGPRSRRVARVVELMREYSTGARFGCDAWREFEAEYSSLMQCDIGEPVTESALATFVSDTDGRAFCDYWTDVSNGVSWDFDAPSGARAGI